MSRQAVLGRIVDSTNHVLTFHSVAAHLNQEFPRQIGWKSASAYPLFCAQHDLLFRPLDIGFEVSNRNLLLLSFRSVCQELFKKRKAIANYSRESVVIDESMDSVQRGFYQYEKGQSLRWTRKGEDDLADYKRLMDRAIRTNNFSEWAFKVLTFSGPVSLVAAGAFTPNKGLDGRPLQFLDSDTAQEFLVVSTSTLANGQFCVVLCHRKGHKFPETFASELILAEQNQIPARTIQDHFCFSGEHLFFANVVVAAAASK